MTNLPTSIKLYHRCKQMKWAHLPVAGGLYDQHPQLIDEWDVLFQLDAEYELRRQREREAEMRAKRS